METTNNNNEQENNSAPPQSAEKSEETTQHTTDTSTPLGMAKEDMLDMTKGAAFMDNTKWVIQGVEGKSISGAGSGPGTGEISADADRPTTEGTPAVNDYVSPESLQEAQDAVTDTMAESNSDAGVKGPSPQNLTHADPASGFPMGGAARNEDDKLPSGDQ